MLIYKIKEFYNETKQISATGSNFSNSRIKISN